MGVPVSPRARPVSYALGLIAADFNIPLPELIGRNRVDLLAAFRNMAMMIARHGTGMSFITIGAAMAGRDHTTVLSGVRQARDAVARSDWMRERSTELILNCVNGLGYDPAQLVTIADLPAMPFFGMDEERHPVWVACAPGDLGAKEMGDTGVEACAAHI